MVYSRNVNIQCCLSSGKYNRPKDTLQVPYPWLIQSDGHQTWQTCCFCDFTFLLFENMRILLLCVGHRSRGQIPKPTWLITTSTPVRNPQTPKTSQGYHHQNKKFVSLCTALTSKFWKNEFLCAIYYKQVHTGQFLNDHVSEQSGNSST